MGLSNLTVNTDRLTQLTPEMRRGMEAQAQQIVLAANRSAAGHYYAWRWNRDNRSISIFRGTRRAFQVEFGTSAIQGGRHLKKALDRHRVR